MPSLSTKDTRPASPPKSSPPLTNSSNGDIVSQVVRLVALVAVLSFVSYVSQIILNPIYGSTGTSLHHSNVIFTISTATSLFTHLGFLGLDFLPPRNSKILGIILIASPLVLPVLFGYSGEWGPVWGPVLSQGVMTWPAVFMVSHDISKFVLRKVVGVYEVRHSLALPAFLALSTSIGLTILLHVSQRWIYHPLVHPYIGILWSRFTSLLYLGLATLLIDNYPTGIRSSGARQQWYNLAITYATFLPFVLIALNRGHVQPSVAPTLLARLPSEYTYLARQESITGMISVVENSKAGYRVLKCDHSLLGGIWYGMKYNELAAQGVKPELLGKKSLSGAESVYTAFLVQEAVRLVVRPAVETKDDKALIIGLGVGITAKSFHNSGINVSIVEIDPVVHRFAQTYFGLPHVRGFTVFEDGRKFIENAAATGERWEYIVHDVFTGGSVPAHLFTREMWQATKAALAQNGVLVVCLKKNYILELKAYIENMVGALSDLSTKAVIATLLWEFDYCRGVTDPLDTSTDTPTNMAIFCASFPIEFRAPQKEDFQGSFLREKALTTFLEHEIVLKDVPRGTEEKLILEDGENRLGEWQVEGALEHWKVIRTVLDEKVWINY